MLALALIASSSITAQTQPASNPLADTAKHDDVDTIPHIMGTIYDVISGPAGTRDWERFHSLFYRGAHFIPSHPDKDGTTVAQVHSTDECVDGAKAYFERNGFYESAVANRVEQWDKMAQVWSTYESRHAKGEKPFQRGINSIQLFNDGKRWWVLNIFWEGEAGIPIPKQYLK